jgi:hypothetical protein
MDLLERYLQAVRFFLPRRNQDDIVRELSENLISQMEDREAELGRPLTEDERADILRRHGHPMLVAGQYRSRQQLIGPVFFPIYLFALKIGLGVAVLVSLVVAGMNAILTGNPLHHAAAAFFEFPGRGLMVFAWTTLSFALLDLAQSRMKLPRTWDPRRLPRVVKAEHRIARFDSLCELIFTAACVVWLLLIPGSPFLLMGPGAAFLETAPIWRMVYEPILLLTAATAVVSLVNFVRPYWTPARSVARIAIHAISVLVWILLLQSGEWVVAKSGATMPGGVDIERIVDLANAGCRMGLMVATIIGLLEVVRELRRLISRRKSSSTSGSPAVGDTQI